MCVIGHRGRPIREDAHDTDILRQRVDHLEIDAIIVGHLGHGLEGPTAARGERAGALDGLGDDVEPDGLGFVHELLRLIVLAEPIKWQFHRRRPELRCEIRAQAVEVLVWRASRQRHLNEFIGHETSPC